MKTGNTNPNACGGSPLKTSELEDYKNYLHQIGLSSGHNGRNQVTMSNHVNTYAEWLKHRGLDIQTATYKDLMDHVGYLQKQGKGIHRVNHALRSISHHYEFKGWENIAQTTRMRGVPRTQPQGLLSEEDLQELYESYFPEPHKNNYHYTDKLILGLLIYQALDMSEFMKIELQDVQLEKGTIYIRSGRQKKERYIPLKANQVLSLDRYIREASPKSADRTSDRLFSPQADNYNLLHWQFKQLSKKVKAHGKEEMDIHIHKLGQLRQSRIAIWVREEGLRKAQYLAGFRNVSSAERYQRADLSDLKKQVDRYHPLR
ncbi:tyrosine-type recombinase/integrase [Flagellimonas sp. 389]|uniref:tyrosine-type recombinase/integrase n=1 Tax=Flagellimonas sp. 389 TaxID=2835862 RepID=UPI001BD36BDE|nr:tyrosine-type recombinase/integrase [Flagellimonas sp. 389]MBS9463280.1 tyrosine-type recombinase/integrase [Flagellimonas sp. 389]